MPTEKSEVKWKISIFDLFSRRTLLKMGCGESKIKEISLTPEIQMNDTKFGMYDTPKPTAIVNPNYDETTILPNRLLVSNL